MSSGIAVFDFDWSLVEQDSDYWTIHSLSPELWQEILETRGEKQWTDLMDESLCKLQDRGIVEKDIQNAAQTIPFASAMRDTLRGLKERNIPVIIMSDANTLYIEAILKVNGVCDCVSDIITNPNYYDDKGRVRIHRRVLATDPQHECIHPCNVNICKGKELDDMMQRYKPKKMAYIGDGKNDFCPATRLKESDVFFMRDGRGLESYLVSEPQQTNKLISKKIHWVEPNTVLENILDFFDE